MEQWDTCVFFDFGVLVYEEDLLGHMVFHS